MANCVTSARPRRRQAIVISIVVRSSPYLPHFSTKYPGGTPHIRQSSAFGPSEDTRYAEHVPGLELPSWFIATTWWRETVLTVTSVDSGSLYAFALSEQGNWFQHAQSYQIRAYSYI